MNWIDIIVFIAAVTLVVVTIIYNINKKKKSKGACDCPYAGNCSSCGKSDPKN